MSLPQVNFEITNPNVKEEIKKSIVENNINYYNTMTTKANESAAEMEDEDFDGGSLDPPPKGTTVKWFFSDVHVQAPFIMDKLDTVVELADDTGVRHRIWIPALPLVGNDLKHLSENDAVGRGNVFLTTESTVDMTQIETDPDACIRLGFWHYMVMLGNGKLTRIPKGLLKTLCPKYMPITSIEDPDKNRITFLEGTKLRRILPILPPEIFLARKRARDINKAKREQNKLKEQEKKKVEMETPSKTSTIKTTYSPVELAALEAKKQEEDRKLAKDLDGSSSEEDEESQEGGEAMDVVDHASNNMKKGEDEEDEEDDDEEETPKQSSKSSASQFIDNEAEDIGSSDEDEDGEEEIDPKPTVTITESQVEQESDDEPKPDTEDGEEDSDDSDEDEKKPAQKAAPPKEEPKTKKKPKAVDSVSVPIEKVAEFSPKSKTDGKSTVNPEITKLNGLDIPEISASTKKDGEKKAKQTKAKKAKEETKKETSAPTEAKKTKKKNKATETAPPAPTPAAEETKKTKKKKAAEPAKVETPAAPTETKKKKKKAAETESTTKDKAKAAPTATAKKATETEAPKKPKKSKEEKDEPKKAETKKRKKQEPAPVVKKEDSDSEEEEEDEDLKFADESDMTLDKRGTLLRYFMKKFYEEREAAIKQGKAQPINDPLGLNADQRKALIHFMELHTLYGDKNLRKKLAASKDFLKDKKMPSKENTDTGKVLRHIKGGDTDPHGVADYMKVLYHYFPDMYAIKKAEVEKPKKKKQKTADPL